VSPKTYETPIEDLDLSVRAYNCLKRSGITKVGQVLEMSEDDLLAVRNFGRKSLQELRERLVAKGLVAPTDVDSSAAGAGPEDQAEEIQGEESAASVESMVKTPEEAASAA
jgi:DNA-directed RNA polymerase subunit alpha